MLISKCARLLPITVIFISMVLGIFLLVYVLNLPTTKAMAETAVAPTINPQVDQSGKIHLNRIGSYTGSGSEIAAYNASIKRLYIVTGGPYLEILDISNPITPTLVTTVTIGEGGANSVAVGHGYVAVAVANSDTQANGFVHFYDLEGTFVVSVTAGALPDMLTFTPDGQSVLVANEGEPNDDYDVDPEGSVSVIDISGGIPSLTQADVTQIGFSDFNTGGPRAGELPADVRIFGPGATVAQDLEPEYIAVSPDSSTAWVTLQENNAVAVIDLTTNEVSVIAALGFKDYSAFGNQLDPSDRDSGIALGNWPVKGMYQPDAIAAIEAGGQIYLLTANEGDARDYDGFSEEARVKNLDLDSTVFTPTAFFQNDANLGRLKTTIVNGDANNDDLYEEIYAFGGRSFSVWDASGNLVYDSGDQFEHLAAALSPDSFNSEGDNSTFDERSDDKGTEPEGIAKGMIDGRYYAFIGLERIGGIMVYDVTDPTMPSFVEYVAPAVGDFAPEGLLFIPAEDSPNGKALLVVSYEVSGTTAVFEIEKRPSLIRQGSYTGSGSEIPAYDAGTRQIYIVTGGPYLEILDISNPITPTLVTTVTIGEGGANSVAVGHGYVAVAVANSDTQANGFVHFYDLEGTFVVSVTAGALPDMLTFTPDGQSVLVANEGEPNDDYDVDPEGSVSVIDISGGIPSLTQADVTQIGFSDFNTGGPRAGELPADVRIFGPGATVAQDLEPEYIAVSPDSSTAWVTLQENNAVAVIDLTTNEVSVIAALGFKDYSAFGNQLDPSDRDSGIALGNWPVKGMYQPDAIAAIEAGGQIYLLTANEGDARDYDGFSEEARVKNLDLDSTVFTPTAFFQNDANLGRLKTTIVNGDANNDDLYEEIYAFGGRSFSVWSGSGEITFDSGHQFEHLTAALSPDSFNSEGDDSTFDERSDDKGTEPEGIAKGMIDGRYYAFIGLERIGGIMVYDITDPTMPRFVEYVAPTNGDTSPEGLLFISAEDSPVCSPLLVVSYEVSGTTAVYRLDAAECTQFLPGVFRN
jgi:DNA-binding beta-propeller fold protein YncE